MELYVFRVNPALGGHFPEEIKFTIITWGTMKWKLMVFVVEY